MEGGGGRTLLVGIYLYVYSCIDICKCMVLQNIHSKLRLPGSLSLTSLGLLPLVYSEFRMWGQLESKLASANIDHPLSCFP